MSRPQKIAFGEMRESGVRGVLVYCSLGQEEIGRLPGRVLVNSRCLLSGVERKWAKGSRLRDRSADLEHCFLREPSNKVDKAGRETS